MLLLSLSLLATLLLSQNPRVNAGTHLPTPPA